MLAIRGRRSSSVGVRVWSGRRAERRVKRTSGGVWRREEVRVIMFSGARKGMVERKARRAERKSMFRECRTARGRGVTESEEEAEAARWLW